MAQDSKQIAAAIKKREEAEEAQRVALAQRAADELLAEEEQAAASAAAKKAKKQRQKTKKLQEQQQQQKKEEQKVEPGQQEAGLQESGLQDPGLLKTGQLKSGLQKQQQAVQMHEDQVQHSKLNQSNNQQAQQQQQQASILLTVGKEEQVQALAQQKQKSKSRRQQQQQQQDRAESSAGQTHDATAAVADGGANATTATSGNDAPVLHKPSAGKATGKAKPKVPAILPPHKRPAAPRSDSSLENDHIPSLLAEDHQAGAQPHAQQALEPQIGTTHASDRELKSAESAQDRAGQLENSPSIREQRGCSSAGAGPLGVRTDSSRPEGAQPENKRLAHLWHLLCCPITQVKLWACLTDISLHDAMHVHDGFHHQFCLGMTSSLVRLCRVHAIKN